MASLKKRGKYYYVRWQKVIGGERLDVQKSLKMTNRVHAERALQKLEELEERGVINPYSKGFDPVKTLEELKAKKERPDINTIREAADYFYIKKAHLSNSTVKNPKKRTQDNSGAYERAIEHFISKNDIATLSPLLVKRRHFDAIIFKPGIKPPTRHFYFRQLRVWWNKLLDWNIVTYNPFPDLKKDLPEQSENKRPKMLSEDELNILFEKFDEDLERKKKIPEYNADEKAQWWFKPLIAVYFYCGLRKHEAAYKGDLEYSGLQGENLYYENGRLEMIYLPPTKGRKERSIPVPEPCRNLIEQYLKRRGKVGHEDYLFIYMGGRRKGYPVTGAQAYKEYKRYVKECDNIPNSRTLHGMRHERITSWLEDGYFPSEAQFMAGHSSMSQTERYTHLKGQNLLRKQRKMEEQNK